MRKFRVHYTALVDGLPCDRSKCIFAHNAHDAKTLVSRNLFQRGILHSISTGFYVFPGTYTGVSA